MRWALVSESLTVELRISLTWDSALYLAGMYNLLVFEVDLRSVGLLFASTFVSESISTESAPMKFPCPHHLVVLTPRRPHLQHKRNSFGQLYWQRPSLTQRLHAIALLIRISGNFTFGSRRRLICFSLVCHIVSLCSALECFHVLLFLLVSLLSH